ncbi:MAG: alpha/beta hydrolase, partial [Chitinophagaceae bacterium]
VVDSLQLNHVILVGHNIGAQAAVAYAARFPGKVNGLLLIGVPLKTTATRVTKIMDQLESEQYDSVTNNYLNYLLMNAQPPTAEILKEGFSKLSKNGVRKMVRGALQYDPVPALRKYTGPVMMLSTADDNAVATWQQLFPKNNYRSIENSSHWIQLDRPALFNEILRKFLMELPRS